MKDNQLNKILDQKGNFFIRFGVPISVVLFGGIILFALFWDIGVSINEIPITINSKKEHTLSFSLKDLDNKNVLNKLDRVYYNGKELFLLNSYEIKNDSVTYSFKTNNKNNIRYDSKDTVSFSYKFNLLDTFK